MMCKECVSKPCEDNICNPDGDCWMEATLAELLSTTNNPEGLLKYYGGITQLHQQNQEPERPESSLQELQHPRQSQPKDSRRGGRASRIYLSGYGGVPSRKGDR